jgi:hypothetical protein
LEYWLNYHGFNKLVIKSKIHANIYFVKNAKTQNGYINKTNNDFCIFERLGHVQHAKKKHFFICYYHFYIYLFICIFIRPYLGKKTKFSWNKTIQKKAKVCLPNTLLNNKKTLTKNVVNQTGPNDWPDSDLIGLTRIGWPD